MCKARWNAAAILVMAVFSFSAVHAQESRATITGAVTDPQGAAIPGAVVTAKNTATNVEVKASTNEAGIYVLPFLTPGSYMVTASAAGFKAAVRDRVELSTGARQQIDFKMEIGGMTEQVTVSGEAELLNISNAVRGTIIDSKKVADLPLL